jgi:tetratricopeptide (TPR) repeat protein
VKSRASSFAFKGKTRNLADVVQQLGVNLVVDGSVLRSGNKLRVNPQLTLAAGDVLLWSETFDRELKDIFAIQDDISRSIARQLQLTLGGEPRRYETNTEAYELYLKGGVLVDRRGPANLDKAADLFTQALAKDPDFAPAHARLAIAHALNGAVPGYPVPFVVAQSIIRTAAVRALALDPELPDAHEAMGWVHARDLDWSSAEKAFKRAIGLNPTLTQTYTSYSSSTLRPLGKRDEALRLLRVALQNDQLNLQVQMEIGRVKMENGEYEAAISTFEQVRAKEPNFPTIETFLARTLVFAGRPAEALSVFERVEPGRPPPRKRLRPPRMVLAYVALGRRAEAEALAAEHMVDAAPSNQAVMYTALGDKDRAFEALERAARDEPQHLPILLAFPEMAGLRGDPRLVSLRQRLRLPPE